MDLYEESLEHNGLYLQKLERNIRIKPLDSDEQFAALKKLPKAIISLRQNGRDRKGRAGYACIKPCAT